MFGFVSCRDHLIAVASLLADDADYVAIILSPLLRSWRMMLIMSRSSYRRRFALGG